MDEFDISSIISGHQNFRRQNYSLSFGNKSFDTASHVDLSIRRKFVHDEETKRKKHVSFSSIPVSRKSNFNSSSSVEIPNRLSKISFEKKEMVESSLIKLREKRREFKLLQSKIEQTNGLLELEQKRVQKSLARQRDLLKRKVDQIYESSLHRLEISKRRKEKDVEMEKKRCLRLQEKVNDFLKIRKTTKFYGENGDEGIGLIHKFQSLLIQAEKLENLLCGAIFKAKQRIRNIDDIKLSDQEFELQEIFEKIVGN